jgi:hypothetical protein
VTNEVIGWVAWTFGALFVVVVTATIVAASRRRAPVARRRGPAPYRVRGRSIRGWQASAIREIRRAGRQHGKRG